MQDSRRRVLAAVTAGVTGLVAGCGGNDTGTPAESTATGTAEPTATDTEAATPTAAGTETPGETAEPTATDTESLGPPMPPAEVVSVGADGLRFSPESFEIAVGDTVQWEWEGGGHNVRPDTVPSGSDWRGTEGGDGTTYDSGHTYSHRFDVAGTYSYCCAPHQGAGMTGSFTVTE